MDSKSRYTEIYFFAAIFAVLVIFFLCIHPLVVFDADDWTYISHSRKAIPTLKAYNPGKIFPETVQSILASVAVYCIYPFTHDYIGSFTIVYGLTVCICILAYIFSFYKFIRWAYPRMFASHALTLTALFLLFHFSVFKSALSNNTYLFHASDLNCYFNYIIPDLFNAILVLYLIRHRFSLPSEAFVKNGLIIVFTYLSVYSNVFMTGILLSAVGLDLLYNLAGEIKQRNFAVSVFIKDKWYSFLVFIFWLVMLFSEANGSRAGAIIGSAKSYAIKSSVKSYLLWGTRLNKLTLVIVVLALVIAAALIIKHFKEKDAQNTFRMITFLLGSFVIESAFLIAVCGVTGVRYLNNSQVIFGVMFYAFLIAFIALGYIDRHHPIVVSVLILLMFILFANINNGRYIFLESTQRNVRPQAAKLVGEDLMRQIVTASEKGQSKMVLYVPKGDNIDNWPHANYLGERMSATLFKHGIIRREISITIEPDISMNQRYDLGY